MTKDRVEGLARAICEAAGEKPDDPAYVRYPGPEPFGIAWEKYRPQALAALDYMETEANADRRVAVLHSTGAWRWLKSFRESAK